MTNKNKAQSTMKTANLDPAFHSWIMDTKKSKETITKFLEDRTGYTELMREK